MSELTITDKDKITKGAPSKKKKGPGQKKTPKTMSAEVRERMIAEAAYYKAESRGFAGDDSQRDWLEAESEIDALLIGAKKR